MNKLICLLTGGHRYADKNIVSFARSLSDEYKGYADSEHKNPLLQAGYRGGQISALRILKRIDELERNTRRKDEKF